MDEMIKKKTAEIEAHIYKIWDHQNDRPRIFHENRTQIDFEKIISELMGEQWEDIN